jgi:hypothetical protein
MNLRHLQWFIDEPLPDPEVTLYQISPYSREDAARIIRHLCALAKIDLGQMGEDPASAERIRQALGRVVHAAVARSAPGFAQ